jgi:nucleotide-binding universal stress UspA family protein
MTQAHVFAVIDNAFTCSSVGDYASWIATTVDTPLTFLHTVEHSIMPATSDLSGSIGLGSRETLLHELIQLEERRSKLLIEQGEALLSDAAKTAKVNGVRDCFTMQRHGGLSETLLELEDKIRVLVLGLRTEEEDSENAALGRQIESIIRALHKPVLIVNKHFSRPSRLLLAYDGSDAAKKALNWLTSSPLYKQMVCHLIYVCNDEAAGKNVLSEALERLDTVGIQAHSKVLSGDVASQLLDYQQSHDIDLIVMGCFGHSRLREIFLGSFTLKMIANAQIPLLLLR